MMAPLLRRSRMNSHKERPTAEEKKDDSNGCQSFLIREVSRYILKELTIDRRDEIQLFPFGSAVN